MKRVFKKLLVFFQLIAISYTLSANSSFAATVVATINSVPVTDADITARTKLMTLQGQNYTDNRVRALNNIIDDSVKLKYAAQFKVEPTDKDVDAELKKMNLSSLSATEKEMARSAIKANMAWQIMIARTIMPTISVDKDEIAKEAAELEKQHGLPVEVTFIRLVNIPANAAAKLTEPNSCDDAMKIATDLGGAPQKMTVPQYELSEDVRGQLAELAELRWSPIKDDSVLLICGKKKMKEYAQLDDMLEKNTIWKKAMFQGDQQLKQLRRKAVVVIMDDRYKI